MERYGTAFEVKAVDGEQRIVEGYASAFGNVDRVGDVIDSTAFDRTLREKPPGDVGVFIGHQHADLPIGQALEIRPDAKGLFTRTLVLDGPQGDQLLAAARKGLLGMSIGYTARAARPDQVQGKTVRRLTDIDLVEYSFAAKATIANPQAVITGVKHADEDVDLGAAQKVFDDAGLLIAEARDPVFAQGRRALREVDAFIAAEEKRARREMRRSMLEIELATIDL